MKVFLRVIQVIFGILAAISLLMLAMCISIKDSSAILGGVIISILTLGLFLLVTFVAKSMGKEKTVKVPQPIQTAQSSPMQQRKSNCKFSGRLIEATNVAVPTGAFLEVSFDNELITISNSNVTFTLQKPQLIYAYVSFDKTPIMKNKSVVGRGLVGAALMGPAGAVIGSASAVGSKKGVSVTCFAYIQFYSVAKEECQLVFSVDEYEFRKADKFAKAVNPTEKVTVEL